MEVWAKIGRMERYGNLKGISSTDKTRRMGYCGCAVSFAGPSPPKVFEGKAWKRSSRRIAKPRSDRRMKI